MQFELDRDHAFAARIQALLAGEEDPEFVDEPPVKRSNWSWILGGAAVLLIVGMAAAAVLAYPRANRAETPTVAASPSPSPFGPTWKIAANVDVKANDIKFDRQYGDLFATANTDGTITLFKVGRKSRLARFDSTMGAMTSGAQDLKSLDFSADGKRLVAGGMRGSVEIWNLDTGKLVTKPFGAGRMGVINGVSFAPDRQSVATASADGTVRLWNPYNGQQIGEPITTAPEGSEYKVAATAVQFSPNGKVLATLSDDGSVAFFDAESHERIRQADSPSTTVGTIGDELVYRPDGRVVATVSASGLHMWDARTGKTLKAAKTDSIGAFAFRPDGKMLACASIAGPVRLYDPATLAPVGNPPPGEFRFVDAMSFSPTGKYLAAAETDGSVRIWST
ncbi:WD40 repeat domain-containing protein [Cryptosporangium phraense]|uniref:WD40 repeat domain-containing protein n=1 Tax=Cryptosporangium phraense TaxID=2593070 RepID=A0A545AJ28_9ACTN|nr:WD40 repeat domain-containing protein [Cryptosporangium phraense]TQS41321.1 WD40 repeat domain-containing protein [Cryptosporangium phraense]